MRTLVTAIIVVAALAFPAAVAADSIVYSKGGNVFIANPDGSGEYQVTLDGSPANPYQSPAQADDGTIVAARGSGRDRRIHRMRQNGAPLNEPIPAPVPPDDPRLSPNGAWIAYWFLSATSYFGCDYCIGTYGQTLYSYPDRLTRYEEVQEPYTGYRPSWFGNDLILMDIGAAQIWFHQFGTTPAKKWFGVSDTNLFDGNTHPELNDPELSPGGDRLAVVFGDHQEQMALFSTNGVPPGSTTAPTGRCLFSDAVGGKFESPSWSPDGRSLAWQEADGIWTASAPDLGNCASIAPRLTIPGGSRPDWGPANVNPGPRATTTTTTTDTTDTTNTTNTTPTTDGRAPAVGGFRARRQTLPAALARGFSASFATDAAGAAQLVLTVTGRDSRGLRIAKTARVATGSKRLAAAGRHSIVARFTKKARRKFGRARRVKLTATLTVTDAEGDATTQRRSVALVRR